MIVTEQIQGLSMAEREVEIVEHKGIGHPDTLCDGIAEAISVALNRKYMEICGTPLHNNIDKGLLIAGEVEKRFGGGRVVRPMELVIGDRATRRFGGRDIPVQEIALNAAREWLGRNLPRLNPESDINIRIALAPASEQLSGLYTRQNSSRSGVRTDGVNRRKVVEEPGESLFVTGLCSRKFSLRIA